MILVTGATGKQFEDVARHCGSLQGDVPVRTRNSVGRERPSDGVHRWTNTRPRHLARAVFATFRTIVFPLGTTSARSFQTMTWSRHSRRREPITRSTNGFCQGERGAVGRSSMPIASAVRRGSNP
jgi:hypothetical protein